MRSHRALAFREVSQKGVTPIKHISAILAAGSIAALALITTTASAQTGGAVGVGVGVNEGVVVSGTVGSSPDDAAAKASRAANGGVSAAVGGSVASGHTRSADAPRAAPATRTAPEPTRATTVPAGCIAVTITRPAEDIAGLLEKNMARSVFFGEGITPESIKSCDAKARVSQAEGHVATFAGYKPGVGATYILPKTGKQALVYFSRCVGGKRVYRSALVTLDGSKTVPLAPKEVGNAGCTAA